MSKNNIPPQDDLHSSPDESPDAQAPQSQRSASARRSLLTILLAAVFFASCFCTLVARVSYAAVMGATAAPAEEKPSGNAALTAYPRVSAQMENDLAAAINPSLEWTTADIHDPFVDREGYGGTKINMPVTSPAPVTSFPAGLRPPSGALAQQPATPTPAQTAQDAAAARAAAEEAAKASVKGREYDPSAYSYKDVLPVGITGPGRTRDAFFYGIPSKKYFSVSVNTRLRDATLEAITEDGVVFRTASGQVSVAWSRVAAPRDGGKRAGQPESNMTITRPSVSSTPSAPERPSNNKSRQYEGLQYAVRDRYSRAP